MTDPKALAKRVDKLTFALLLLISSLRANIKVEDGKEAISSIPTSLLDSIERMLKNL